MLWNYILIYEIVRLQNFNENDFASTLYTMYNKLQ